MDVFIAFAPSDLILDINGGALGSTVLLLHLHLLTLSMAQIIKKSDKFQIF